MTFLPTKPLPDGLELLPVLASDVEDLEMLHARVFGPGRFARTAFRLRERAQELFQLSRKASIKGQLAGAVTLSRIAIGELQGVLLGPLAVSPQLRDLGIGRLLLADAVQAAFHADEPCVLLVGDLPYYEPAGFQCVPFGTMTMPGPVDPSRLLIAMNPDHDDLPAGRVTGTK